MVSRWLKSRKKTYAIKLSALAVISVPLASWTSVESVRKNRFSFSQFQRAPILSHSYQSPTNFCCVSICLPYGSSLFHIGRTNHFMINYNSLIKEFTYCKNRQNKTNDIEKIRHDLKARVRHCLKLARYVQVFFWNFKFFDWKIEFPLMFFSITCSGIKVLNTTVSVVRRAMAKPCRRSCRMIQTGVSEHSLRVAFLGGVFY